MSTIEKSIHVDVPVRTAYDQWTRFESFPVFMDGVEEVRQVDDTHVHWKAQIGGVSREWEAEIIDQTPDERITWRATDGTTNAGTVSFASTSSETSRVTLRLEFEPEGIVEKAGDALHLVTHQASSDLEEFKRFIESHPDAEDGWRGTATPSDFTSPTLL